VINVSGHRLGAAENKLASLGDASTLADPSVIDDLVKNRAGA